MDARNQTITTLRGFEITDNKKSMGIFVFTVLALFILVSSSIYCFTISPWLSSLFWIPSGIILCRFFVLQHDCGHLSFFTNKKHNQIGSVIMGFFTMIPGSLWTHIHNVHHGLVGNLDKRNINPELWTMTVKEYSNSSNLKKLGYRIMRSKIMRLIITPALWMIVPKIPLPHLGRKIFISIILHDIIYGIVFFFAIKHQWLLIFTLTYLIPLYVFNFLASIMFYLQHQYEDTSWEQEEEWDLYTASISGSSYLKVNRIMRWITGDVGCHHIHHLNTKIPCYKLHEATEKVDQYLNIEPIYLNELFHHLNLVLWDEKSKKLVSFKALSKL